MTVSAPPPSKPIADGGVDLGVSNPRSNIEKNPEDWISGVEPMTGAQASYLKTLSAQVHEPAAFDERLTTAEASRRIERLRGVIGLAATDE
jgi:hypothetical protein